MEPRRRQARRARPADADLTCLRAGVLAANAAFYRAMRHGDYPAMDRLWARARPVTCTHPDWQTLVGRSAVMQSWRLILEHGAPPSVWPMDVHPIVTGGTALVLCREEVDGVGLIASNGFVREGGGWRMLNHQSAYCGGQPVR